MLNLPLPLQIVAYLMICCALLISYIIIINVIDHKDSQEDFKRKQKLKELEEIEQQDRQQQLDLQFLDRDLLRQNKRRQNRDNI
jgi:hypothetical protein